MEVFRPVKIIKLTISLNQLLNEIRFDFNSCHPVGAAKVHQTLQIPQFLVCIQLNISLARGMVDAIRVVPEDAPVSESAVEAIVSADQIILGPGSLYTSIIAAMVVPGIVEAVNTSTAPLVYVANIVTQDGETLGMDAVDHLQALIRLTGVRPPSAIVASDSSVSVDPPLEVVGVDAEAAATYGTDLVTADLLDETADRPRHDPTRLGAVLRGLVQS